MPSLLPPTMVVSSRLLSRAPQFSACRVTPTSNSLLRVTNKLNKSCLSSGTISNSHIGRIPSLWARLYATKPQKPKAHTGRAASATKPASKKKLTKTEAEEKGSAKKDVATTEQSKAKPKTKPKPKPKTKPKRSKAKAKPKPKKRKILTEAQKATKAKKDASQKKLELKETALLDKKNAAPKMLIEVPFQLILAESAGTTFGGEAARVASEKYKNLTPAEKEHYNHIANENKAKNEAAYKNWVLKQSPLQIKQANRARAVLKAEAKKAGKPLARKYSPIEDERLVKHATNGYAFFFQDRIKSGDMKHMTVKEIGQLVGQEWRTLGDEDKRKYLILAARDLDRYVDESKTVYGIDVIPSSK